MILNLLRRLLRRPTAPDLLDSREYDNLVRRNFKPYSLGHRRMYDVPIERLRGQQHRIYEAGFGIGYGLDQMVAANVVREYVGCEPNADSFQYVASRHGGRPGVTLLHASFTGASGFDHVFCIEVIEHIPLEHHAATLRALRDTAATLWFSTPCKTRVAHEGVRTSEEWEALLQSAGFLRVVVDRSQWTYLYHCE